jgi:hypothetical protein
MRVGLFTFLLIVGSLRAPSTEAAAIRISQIYPGGGGDAGAQTPYGADFIELFNDSGTTVDVGGWLLAYGGNNATATFGCAGCTNVLPSGTTIQPCSYLLVQVSPRSPDFGAALPNADATLLFGSGIRSSGVMALLSGGIPSGACLTIQPGVEDLVGWGATNCEWGSTGNVPAINNTQALLRNIGGMSYSGDNYVDFALGPPTPRNAAATQNQTCVLTPSQPDSWGKLKSLYR